MKIQYTQYAVSRLRSMMALAAALLISVVGFGPLAMDAQHSFVEKVESPEKLTFVEVHSFGRTTHGADGMFVYQWPGVYFLAAYEGPALYFKVGQGKQDLHITVDGQSIAMVVDGAASVYRIATPNAGAHRVRIDVVNENQDGPKSLGAFAVAVGGKSIHIASRERQIEFIGDSHTVGYGNASPSRECSADQVWATTDTTQSLGADAAMHYGANYQINAISGHGVVRNYDGGAGVSVPAAYPYLLLDKQQKYDDPGWNPQVIAISLGTNDFSTPLRATEIWKTREELHTAFEAAYTAFVKKLRFRNPKALIVLWSTNMSDEEIAQEGKKVVQKLRAGGDSRVDFVELTGLSFTACHWHPSAADDRLISGKLIEDIDTHQDIWPNAKGVTAVSQPANIPQ